MESVKNNALLQPVRFSNQNRQFFITLKRRVDDYFRENKLSKYANGKMYFKIAFMLLLFLIPYFIILFTPFHPLITITLYLVMGIGMSGVGLSIMHDANHGSISNKAKINNLLGYSLNLIGGNKINWQLQHNNLHHTYTNIDGHDEDIAPPGILRFSPHSKYRKIHKYQYLYAWFFYSLMTFLWVLIKDFVQLIRYDKMGLLKIRKTSLAKEIVYLIFSKIVYVIYMIVVPILFSPHSWPVIIVGYCLMHFLCGLILAAIFQPAHVIPDTDYPLPNESGNIENDFAIHQMQTTANFAPNNKLLSWFVGGLNYQVEHHLFPSICHIHYANISPIVKQTALEFGVPYYSNETFRKALSEHIKLLKRFGQDSEEKIAA